MKRATVSLLGVAALVLLLASCTADITTEPATLPGLTPTAPTQIAAATASPQPTSRPEQPPTATSQPPTAQPAPVTHTVEAGDTLLALAMRYGVPMAAIQLESGLGDSTLLQVGQSLTIPPQSRWGEVSPFWILYAVEPGQTLLGIARAFGLDLQAIQAVNGLGDADLLHVGQHLVLPLDAPVAAQVPTATAAPAARAAATATPAAEPPAEAPVPPTVPLLPPPPDAAAWPHEVARLINEVRTAHGLPPLIYNEVLALAAQGQASDCAQRGWCSHTGSDGADLRTRLLRAGYDGSGWAECWAQSLTPRGAIDMWMDEVPPADPHRRTLLSTWLTEVGVGVAQTGWGYYFIADFGR